MASGITTNIAKRIFLKTLAGLRVGYLEVVCPEYTYSFGQSHDPLQAVIAVHEERFFLRALLAGHVGIGEAYMDGDWSDPRSGRGSSVGGEESGSTGRQQSPLDVLPQAR